MALCTYWLEPAYALYKIVRSAVIVAQGNMTTTSLSLHIAVFLGGGVGILVCLTLMYKLRQAYKTFGRGFNEKCKSEFTQRSINDGNDDPLFSHSPDRSNLPACRLSQYQRGCRNSLKISVLAALNIYRTAYGRSN